MLPTGTSAKVEICQKTEVKEWTGRVEKDGCVQTAFMVFESSSLRLLDEEGLADVLDDRVIPAGRPGVDTDELTRIFGRWKVMKFKKGWTMMLSKIPHAPVALLILVCGSPHPHFLKFNQRRTDAENNRLEEEWKMISARKSMRVF